MINIAILGFGIIGSGVAEVIDENKNIISKKIGDEINIKYILDLRKIEGKYSEKQTSDVNNILSDPDISLAVETMGGSHPAYEYTKALLQSGKSVVTSNKEAVACFGADLLNTAIKNNVSYFFEASVGGGIPIIRPIYNCLAANKIKAITAILNGTTNFILTQMTKECKSFNEALLLAQRNGYAEANPDADINGTDSCRKICILSSLAFGRGLPPEKVYTEGIKDIKLKDMQIAEKHSYKIKLIAKSTIKNDNMLNVYVSPHLVHKDCPLFNIDDVYNGVLVTGNVIGDVMFYGKGAGKMPTASAVVADIIDALNKNTKNIIWSKDDGSYVTDYKKEAVKLYIRTGFVINNPENFIKELFPRTEVFTDNNEIYFFTDEDIEDEFDYKIDAMKKNGFDITTTLRII